MGRKSQGTSLERRMVKNAFKAGGWGFRAPGSGTFTVNKNGNRTRLQSKCVIDLGENVKDIVYKTEYLTTDYVAYYPEWNEIRVVEAKSVRAAKVDGKQLTNARDVSMVEYYYLTDKKNGDLVKSNFCIELERTWLLAEIMDGKVFNVPVTPYFQVRFINANQELFITIPELLKKREKYQDVLKVLKDGENNVTYDWQERTLKET